MNKWFAWYPVCLTTYDVATGSASNNGKLIWLKHVNRILHHGYLTDWYEYTPLES